MDIVKQAYHHKDLRNALVDEALTILASGGPGDITLRELARRLGVTHTAPYAHFADKKSLLEAVADEGFDRLAKALSDARSVETEPGRRFLALGLAYVRFARENPNLYRLMFTDPVLANDPDCDLLRDEENNAFKILLNTLAMAGVPEGSELEHLGVGVWSMVHGIAMLEIDRRLQTKTLMPDADEIVRVMSGYVVRGLGVARPGS